MGRRMIWKFQLKIQASQIVQMPAGAELLSVQDQLGLICLWALVRPDAVQVQRKIGCQGTGHLCDSLSCPSTYIGTVQTPPYVWHFFDHGEIEDE